VVNKEADRNLLNPLYVSVYMYMNFKAIKKHFEGLSEKLWL